MHGLLVIICMNKRGLSAILPTLDKWKNPQCMEKIHGLNLAELGWGKLLTLRAGPGWVRKRAGPGAAGSPRSWPARSTHRGGERREAGDAGATATVGLGDGDA